MNKESRNNQSTYDDIDIFSKIINECHEEYVVRHDYTVCNCFLIIRELYKLGIMESDYAVPDYT
jgi:hypothetical protein